MAKIIKDTKGLSNTKQVNNTKPASNTKPEETNVKIDSAISKIKQDQENSQKTIIQEAKNEPLKVCPGLLRNLKELAIELEKTGNKNITKKLEKIYARGIRNRFCVAVVGEFSRGKSTFINNFVGKELLPIGDLPTTAMLTRIRYNKKEKIAHFDENNKLVREYDVSQESWDGLIADNFGGKDPKGTVLAGVNSSWLAQNNVEIMDTPGAGDLEEGRAKLIGDALMGCDGAIIATTATGVLSLSEKLFIEQRLISRKTPFLMLIITKLDLIPKSQRKGVIDYVFNKLSSWNIDIPVYIPMDVEMEDDTYKDIIGMDKIKECISSWINDKDRVKFTEDWIIAQAMELLEMELYTLSEKKALLDVSSTEKRNEIINSKKQKLSDYDMVWKKLHKEMIERFQECCNTFDEKIMESKNSIIEKLQYEGAHSNNPQKWWKEDYPYRQKLEITNMSVSIENTISRIVSSDARWFSSELMNNFKIQVTADKGNIVDKNSVDSLVYSSNLKLSNLDKKRNRTRVATTVLSLAGAAVCCSVGFFPMVATMGIGTGSSILSEKLVRKKIEEQHREIKEAIKKDIPMVIDRATADSKERLKALYNDIMKSADEKQKEWKATQLEIIDSSTKVESSNDKKMIGNQIAIIRKYMDILLTL